MRLVKQLPLILVSFFFSISLHAQHCPWDCCGLIMINSDLKPAEMQKLKLVLTDGNKQIVIDTLYGSSEKNADTCYIRWGEEFLAHKTSLVAANHWYAYDTMLHFCKGHYVVRYNYCKYEEPQNQLLFLRYTDAAGSFHYLPVHYSNRIHLHNYNDQIRTGQTTELNKIMEPFVMDMGKDLSKN